MNNALTALKNASQFGLDFIKEFCLKFIIKETNFNQIVSSKEFETLDQPLMVEIIRRRQQPQQHRSISVMERDGNMVQIPATSPPCVSWSAGTGGGSLPFVSFSYPFSISNYQHSKIHNLLPYSCLIHQCCLYFITYRERRWKRIWKSFSKRLGKSSLMSS